jgi:hypothetical protein
MICAASTAFFESTLADGEPGLKPVRYTLAMRADETRAFLKPSFWLCVAIAVITPSLEAPYESLGLWAIGILFVVRLIALYLHFMIRSGRLRRLGRCACLIARAHVNAWLR